MGIIFEIIIKSFSPALSSPQTLPYALLAPVLNHGLSFISCCFVHLCICMYKHIPRYYLLGLCNVTRMCVLRTDTLVLDKQKVYSSLGKTIFSLQILYLPVIICKWWRLIGFLLSSLARLFGMLVRIYEYSFCYYQETEAHRKKKFLVFWLFQSSHGPEAPYHR